MIRYHFVNISAYTSSKILRNIASYVSPLEPNDKRRSLVSVLICIVVNPITVIIVIVLYKTFESLLAEHQRL